MKIIYLANIRFPTEKAHGVHYAKMCEAFAEQGCEVELVVAKRYNPNLKSEDPFEYYNIEKNFKIKKLLVVDLLRWVIQRGPFGTWLLNLTFAKRAFWYILFRKVDLIYSRDALPLLFISLIRKNFIYELHEYRAKDKKIYRRLAKKGKGIVVITQSIKELLIQDAIDEKRILVATDGVDIKKLEISHQRSAIRRKLGLPQNKKVILYNGSLYKWKGVYTLVQISNFRFQISDFIIVLVGGMQYDIERLKRFIQENNLPSDKILMLGHKPYKDMPNYLAVADVLVLPNSARKKISQKFTSPLKMFEFMAAQKPIVASNLSSIREVLNENNAILVKADDPKSLAKGIERALTNQELVNKIVAQAFKDVQEYTWDKRVEKIIKWVIAR